MIGVSAEDDKANNCNAKQPKRDDHGSDDGLLHGFILEANVRAHPRRDGSSNSFWWLIAVGWRGLFCRAITGVSVLWVLERLEILDTNDYTGL